MVTWGEVEKAISVLVGKKLNGTMWMVELPIGETGKGQQVFIAYEIVRPDMEFIKIESPIGFTENLSIEEVVRNFGDLTIGSISYTPIRDRGGVLSIGTNIPLSILDLSEPAGFLIYLAVLANAADTIKAQSAA